MVQENLLKLEIKRLRDQLNSKADDVYSLENRRLQLETAMNERQLEIKIHTEMLTAQLKAAEAEKSQISAELHERISKIDKLRKRWGLLRDSIMFVSCWLCFVRLPYRYEILTLAPADGEEEHSQAYYVIKVWISSSLNNAISTLCSLYTGNHIFPLPLGRLLI